MPLRYLLDEHLRGPLWDAVQRHNFLGVDPIDVVRVGDPADLPLGTEDPLVLRWAEARQRVLVTEDKSTMATHLATHLASGRRSPGVMTPRPRMPLAGLLAFLVLAAYATDPAEWEGRIVFVP